jgi:hypothetical protein
MKNEFFKRQKSLSKLNVEAYCRRRAIRISAGGIIPTESPSPHLTPPTDSLSLSLTAASCGLRLALVDPQRLVDFRYVRRALLRQREHEVLPPILLPRGVAPQVAFERQILKPGFHLIGFRLWV